MQHRVRMPVPGVDPRIEAALWLTLFLGLVSPWASATVATPESTEMELPSGLTVPVTRYATSGNRLLLWLPSEFGVRQPQETVARGLAELGIEVWVVDLHTAYFVPVGRQSVASFDPRDIAELIALATRERQATIFLAATGRGAQISLDAVRIWQQAHGTSGRVGGLILFHPYLYASPPEPGSDPQIIASAGATNLPIYLIQPSLSAKHYRLESIVDALSEGGSPVFAQALPGVTDGFHLRGASDISETDLAARRTLPATLAQAMRVLEREPRPTRPPAQATPSETRPNDNTAPESGLVALGTDRPAPPLELPDLQSKISKLEDYRGRVVLLSFWTSWCPPCVEELPSLRRLSERLAHKPFAIVSVNVGEDLATVNQFIDKHPMPFPVLHDAGGSTVASWQVYAYPTNYLIDPSGGLRFGHVGALDWDTPEIVQTIESLIESPP